MIIENTPVSLDRYAVIGNPARHSKSPLIHDSFARQTGQQLIYEILETSTDNFLSAVDTFVNAGGRGLNVTTPFKLDAFALASIPSEGARSAGAANALKFQDGEIFAENFDGIGLVNDIQNNLGYKLSGRHVLLLGAGGAALGAVLPLLDARPKSLVIANRTLEKAQRLADIGASHGSVSAVSYEGLGSESFDVVINATSASMTATSLPIPPSVFSTNALAYEMAYGRGLTPFLRTAQRADNVRLTDGVGMLVEQAAEAFAWWRNVRPDTQHMIRQLTVPLED